MSREFSLVIRGATVVDGTGEKPFEADIGIVGDRIAAVGRVAGAGSEEIDARGMLVMPGFVDIHTHSDGQATWANRPGPSSSEERREGEGWVRRGRSRWGAY